MSGTARRYLRTARSARMIGLAVLLLVVAAVCARLGVWQLDRAQRQGAVAPDGSVTAVDLTEVLAPQQTFPGDLVGRPVVVAGTFGADEVLVADRPLGGRTGHLVVTPLVVAGTGGLLAVVRGWVAEPAEAAEHPAPGGDVQVRGRLEGGEAARDTGGEITAISPAQLVNRWGGPIYSGYLVLESVRPAQGALTLLPAPEPAPSLDLQNLAYAVQWWIFGGFAVLLWMRMVRDEARQPGHASSSGGGPPDEPAG